MAERAARKCLTAPPTGAFVTPAAAAPVKLAITGDPSHTMRMLVWKREGVLAVVIAAAFPVCAGAGCARDRRDINAVTSARALEPSGLSVQSWPVCALVGPQSDKRGVFGTDLGYTVKEPDRGPGDRLAVLFGDTWAENADRDCRFPRFPADDLAGWLPAVRPRSFAPGPPSSTSPAGCGLLETTELETGNPASWPPIQLFENEAAARDGKPLETTALKTPLSAFSDGRKVYAFYGRNEPAYCGTSSDCPKGLECSTNAAAIGRSLGVCAKDRMPPAEADPLWCRDAMDCPPSLTCRPAERGSCMETEPFRLETTGKGASPAWYRNDPRLGLAHPVYLAVRVAGNRPTDYAVVHRFVTQRFISMATRTVAHFDPNDPSRDDFSPGHHTLFVWGRPWWVGARGAQSLPFLFHVPLEELSQGRFAPRYFGGYGADGRPRWVDNEGDAQPVYGAEGDVDASGSRIRWREPEFDYVNTMSLTWLAPLGRWLMVYGGDLPSFMVKDARDRGVEEPTYLGRSPGAVHFRVAKTPWGRPDAGRPREEGWSSFEPLLTRREAAPFLACGDGGESVMPGCVKAPHADQPRGTAVSPAAGTLGTGEAAPEPAPRRSSLGPKCIAGDAFIGIQEGRGLTGNPIGRLYGANVIEEWTEDVTPRLSLPPGERAVEIYFNVSTWNPYQVVLFKAQIRGTTAP